MRQRRGQEGLAECSMGESPIRVGGTSRLGWQTGTNDRMALGATEPETQRRVESWRVDRPLAEPARARAARSAPGGERVRPSRSAPSATGGAGVHFDVRVERAARGPDRSGAPIRPQPCGGAPSASEPLLS